MFFNLRSSKQRLEWLNHDEAQRIADDLGVDIKDVHQMENRLSSSDMAFDGYGDDSDDSDFVAPSQYLEDDSMNPAMMLENENWEENSMRNLHEAISSLDDRSRDILAKRWLNEEKHTLHDLAAEYGVSAERIRQLENNAMKKVRAVLEA